ncbi:MAG TPA: histidine kinase [Baekduia sp.]|uniref:sensor histidine kinase n=1 Tax=Baekduia sp. TaxID=2600305 RepID=UPI002C1CAC9C|nr:histidine kinase [Baekduia sp.]HMJ37573.1 histidine kinase [Baekduia sp.]
MDASPAQADTPTEPTAATPPEAPTPAEPFDALPLHVALSALAGLAVTIVWGASGGGFYWPMWVWLGVSIPIAVHVLIRFGLSRPTSAGHALAIHAASSGALGVLLLLLWAMTDSPTFWPVWPLLALGSSVAVHALITYADRLPGRRREAQLAERVGELTRTRRGALDVQAAELRRIERDLHDGAQARLVALSLLLGRTEERLADRPEEAELVRRARGEASAAIGELRDLARGIAPPVLADRGLAAAVEALGRRAATPVTVHASELDHRPLPVVETAAYFVVAEALTNVAKHAGAPAHVHLVEEDGRLVIEIVDEGPGGADANGGGLTGLRHRVEALDGELTVTSVAGQGTTVRAELPCGP